MAELTGRVEEWRKAGERVQFRGHAIHVHRRAGKQPLLLFLHGFPSSSYDWRGVLDRLPGRALLTFDFLGFGLSDKPREHRYTLHLASGPRRGASSS
jgi:pimeloyl-ACP methyl ester carboxylesterase